jgi:uncharacterized damage-inducible protein DinB
MVSHATRAPEPIVELFDYSYWAFDRVWSAIDLLSDAQFTSDLGYSLGSIRNMVLHLISSHRRWLCRLQGTPLPDHLRFEDFASRQDVRREWDRAREECLQYVTSLRRTELEQVVPYAIPSRGIETSTPRWQILVHLVNHSTDHRSQMLALMNSKFGIRTPEQDFIIYLWERGSGPG